MLLSVMVFLWGWPAWKTLLNGGDQKHPNCLAGVSKLTFQTPWLHKRVYRTSPVVKVPPGADHAEEAESALYDFNWLSATGTGIFLAAVLSAFWLRVAPGVFWSEFGRTLFRVRWALFTIACMLALAFTTKYSGADASLGLAFTHTGWFYPLFAPLLGWLGVALTGSDTSCNALFGSLQRITAEHGGRILAIVPATARAGDGQMIDAQRLSAAVATEQSGGEGRILRFVFLHSIVLALLVGLLTRAGLPWMIPAGTWNGARGRRDGVILCWDGAALPSSPLPPQWWIDQHRQILHTYYVYSLWCIAMKNITLSADENSSPVPGRMPRPTAPR